MTKKWNSSTGTYDYNRVNVPGVSISLNSRYYVHLMHNNLGVFVYIKTILNTGTPTENHFFFTPTSSPAIAASLNLITQGGFGSINYSNAVDRNKFEYTFGPYTPTVTQGIYVTLSRVWIPNEYQYFTGTALIPSIVFLYKDDTPYGSMIDEGYIYLVYNLYDRARDALVSSGNLYEPYAPIPAAPRTSYYDYVFDTWFDGGVNGSWWEYHHHTSYMLFQLDSIWESSTTSISAIPNTASYPSSTSPTLLTSGSSPYSDLGNFGINSALKVVRYGVDVTF